MEHSKFVPGSLRVAITLEQCWHRVPGGTATSVLGLVRALQRLESVDLVGVSAWHRNPPASPWAPTVPVRPLPIPGTLLYDSWHRLRRPNVERATGPVDVIHATTLAMPPATAPLVVSIHDLAFIDHPEFFTVRGLGFFKRGLELAQKCAAAIVCPSEATRRDCLANGFESERVFVVPWGVDVLPASEDDVAAVRRRHRLEHPFALFVGTIEPRKNLSRLLAAFNNVARRHPDLELVIAGPDGWNEELAELVEQVDADDSVRRRIRALGFIPGAELAALYSAATVFCYPSLMEGFGLPVIEAMAQGTPVITSLGTSTEEVAGDAATLVDPTSVDAITAALEEVLSSADKAQQMSERGQATAREFTWEASALGMESVYRRVSAG